MSGWWESAEVNVEAVGESHARRRSDGCFYALTLVMLLLLLLLVLAYQGDRKREWHGDVVVAVDETAHVEAGGASGGAVARMALVGHG